VLISAGGNVFTKMGADLVAFRLPAP
jgi:glucose dehydrogenase